MDDFISDSTLIRQEKCRYRQSLSLVTVSQASAKARLLLRETQEFADAQVVAIYYPTQGELDPLPLMEACPKKTFVLPVVLTDPNNHLHFYRYDKSKPLQINKFGIEEPKPLPESRFLIENIDLILVPMVAFDKDMNRLGHGAGFYDRTLNFSKKIRKPVLVGFAYEWQKVTDLPVRSWDVKMDLVITNQQAYR
jgi:5-formyltetrahydrofolate cyclo-ligase